MKIKVRMAGEFFPEDVQGKELEVVITNISIPNGSFWTVDSDGYRIEPVNETEEVNEKEPKKGSNTVCFGDKELKTLKVEFK